MFSLPFPAVFPSNLQFCNHFNEFLYFGYRTAIGTVEVRFPKRDATRALHPGTVGISDGQTKILIMAAIVAFVVELELQDHAELKDATSIISKTLASFAAVRCSFTDFENPTHHFLHSLRYLAVSYACGILSMGERTTILFFPSNFPTSFSIYWISCCWFHAFATHVCVVFGDQFHPKLRNGLRHS